MDVTTQLVKHVLSSSLETIPEKAMERAKLSILDTIACAIGGSNDPIARFSRNLG
ncbi:MmgE/PrpD family protein, partial [Mesorhizobium intechi]